ncbi:MAG: nitroreductase family protein [Oscillospiraceae bacterium]|nr:nitroreductase family protein [Oscillospiraceae bacterium]
MNETIQSLKSRRSTKAFTDKQVPEALLNEILEAGLYAPSGMNNQQVVTVAVRDKKTRDQLSRMNGDILGTDTDPFYGAPCVIVVLSDPQRRTWVEDGSLVMGNLMTAAHSVGLGSCWVHRAREMFDSPEGKDLLKQWGLPETLRGIGNCILGQPAQEPAEKPRREGRIVKV